MERFGLIQREVTKTVLSLVHNSDFALAGSGAIREHGLISRPTEDIDLFTTNTDAESFGRNVTLILEGLASSGYCVSIQQQAERFARLMVEKEGLIVNIDLGVDWRENQPVIMDIGPVLNIDDAVGNKVSALFSRSEARDFLDIDRIRTSGRYPDETLLGMAKERDLGFSLDAFIRQLGFVVWITPYQVGAYGVGAEQLERIKARFNEWARELRSR
jgi:hypothetical protein